MNDTPAPFTVSGRLVQARAAFAAINEELRKAVDDLAKAGDLAGACRAYKSLDDAYDDMDSQRKEIYKQIEHLSRSVLPDLFTEEGVTNITLDYGEGLKYRFVKSQRLSASMPDKEGGMAWLRENGGEGLIQETVNASSLSSFAKEFAKTKGKDLPEDFFRTSTMMHTSVTKA